MYAYVLVLEMVFTVGTVWAICVVTEIYLKLSIFGALTYGEI